MFVIGLLRKTEQLGCDVKDNQIGNISAIYLGKKDSPQKIIGSHLDTQPTVGRYDGILAGLEVLRTFKDNNYMPQYPVTVVN